MTTMNNDPVRSAYRRHFAYTDDPAPRPDPLADRPAHKGYPTPTPTTPSK